MFHTLRVGSDFPHVVHFAWGVFLLALIDIDRCIIIIGKIERKTYF